jgi:hypothetical protein
MCSICNHSVPLESAKSDEYGRPVHEKCYVLQTRLRLESAHRRPRREEFDRLLRIFISEIQLRLQQTEETPPPRRASLDT